MGELPKRFGIKLPGAGIRESIELAQYADQVGVDSVWMAEGRLTSDAITPMAVYAASTERVKVGCGVLPIWTRNAALTAQTFATLDFLAPGRMILGLGVWWDPIATKVGVDRGTKLIRATREYLEAIRLLLERKEPVTYDGEYVQLDDVFLDHGETGPHDVPIYLAAVGPQMLRLSGRLADGVVLNSSHTVEATRAEVDEVVAAAEAAGRSREEIDIVQPCTIRLTTDKQAAIARDKMFTTQFIAQQPHVAGPTGIDPDLANRIREVVGGWPASRSAIEEAAKLVPDEIIENIGCYGDEDEIRERLRAYEGAGVDCLYAAADKALIDFLAQGW
jgi:5,10-methylenetetrahydromethanopterin reductase